MLRWLGFGQWPLESSLRSQLSSPFQFCSQFQLVRLARAPLPPSLSLSHDRSEWRRDNPQRICALCRGADRGCTRRISCQPRQNDCHRQACSTVSVLSMTQYRRLDRALQETFADSRVGSASSPGRMRPREATSALWKRVRARQGSCEPRSALPLRLVPSHARFARFVAGDPKFARP
jgi:hypothetical protein